MSPVEQYDKLKALVPRLQGWMTSFGPPPMGKSPPWIVVTISPVTSDMTEALTVSNALWRIDVRVVAETAEAVLIACSKLQTVLDGAYPGAGFSRLVPERDSGVYASELNSSKTGAPYVMRVLTWTVGAHQ